MYEESKTKQIEGTDETVTLSGVQSSNIGHDATLATPEMDGRQVIYTDAEAITRDNVARVLTDVLPIHMGNRAEEEFLYNYVRGRQPIRQRSKKYNAEICNRVVVNIANQIVAFKVANLIGDPLQYVSRNKDTAIPGKIEQLNSFMLSENKSSKDVRLAFWMFTCGVGYRLVLRDKAEAYMADELYDEAPFEVYTLDPRNTFVIRRNDVTGRVIAGVTFVYLDDYKVRYTVYTANETFYLTGSTLSAGRLDRVVTHNFGAVPIIEYPCNPLRMGAFEPVLDLMDAINNIESNRLDGIEQFIQAIMVFENADIDDEKFRRLKEKGALRIFSREGLTSRVYYLNEQLDQTQTQTLVEDLTMLIFRIVGLPSQGNANTSDSSNNGAVIMKNGWWDAESRSKETTWCWKEPETDFLKIVLKICRDSNAFELKISDIELKFSRQNYEDRLTKIQSLTMLLAAGCPPIQAFTLSGAATDPESAAIQYESYQKQKDAELLRTLNDDITAAEHADGESAVEAYAG